MAERADGRVSAAAPSNPVDPLFAQRLADARALHSACAGLSETAPELSARSGLSPGQAAGGWGLLGALVVFLIAAPDALGAAGVVVLSAAFSLVIVFRLAAAMAAMTLRSRRNRPGAAAIPDADLPVLTILAPLYKEGRVAASLVDAIEALDYPPDRLDVKLIVEADDPETLAALEAVALPAWFEILPVPPATPRTKPKALNYGLACARGEIVAVFDAEDRPSTNQPREAVAALQAKTPRGRRKLAVVQAPLAPFNGRAGWLTQHFEIEYAILFRVWLPFLARMGAPLTLGGTSNYFVRRHLVAAGGWDAWNVTEDADLGVRLARKGLGAAMITGPTWEEAPVRFRDWLGQRTRWIKGYLQTWLVLMRDPARAVRDLGLGGFLLLQLSLGGSLLSALLHAPIIAWIVLAALTPLPDIEGWHAAILGVGYGSAAVAALASGLRLSLLTLLTLPIYWPLLSLAMIAALWDLKRRPHFWAKTPHGVRRARRARA